MSQSFTTRLCTSADIPTIARIRFDAFAPSAATAADELSRLMASEPDPDLGRVRTRDESIAATIDRLTHQFRDPSYHIVGAYTRHLLCGVAFWQHITPSTPPASTEPTPNPPQHPSLENRFLAQLNQTRQHTMKHKSYWFLKLLIIDPTHQRKGLGTTLLQWACKERNTTGKSRTWKAAQWAKPCTRDPVSRSYSGIEWRRKERKTDTSSGR